MESLEALLKAIVLGLWFVDMITVALFFSVCQKLESINSSMITMVIVLLSGTFMIGHQAVLEAYMAVNPGYSAWVNGFWYLGFIGLYGLSMRYLYKAHKLRNIRIGSLGQYINTVFLLLGLIQIAQYMEIELYNSDEVMGFWYMLLIPSINIGSTLVCFGMALYSYYHVVFRERSSEELRWTI